MKGNGALMAHSNNIHIGATPFQGKTSEEMQAERRAAKARQKRGAHDHTVQRTQDPNRNRGYRSSHIVSSSPLATAMRRSKFKTTTENTLKVTQVATASQHDADPPQSAQHVIDVFTHKLHATLEHVSQRRQWSDHDLVLALGYAVMLISGEEYPIPTDFHIRRMVERNFARRAWYMCEQIAQFSVALPGMQQPFYAKDYADKERDEREIDAA